MNCALIHELAIGRVIGQRGDALLLGPPEARKGHPAQSHRPRGDSAGLSRPLSQRHRKGYLAARVAAPPLIIDDLGMRKLPYTAAEDLLEVIMRYNARPCCS